MKEESVLENFLKYIQAEKLCVARERILLAVSGGMDSMAMARLFSESPYRFGIAHCNFGLRGKESEEDEVFVRDLAGKYKVPFHTTCFETEKYAGEHKISMQMAARELRYQWFEEIRQHEGYDSIAVAHHLGDLAETMLINLVRGTGVTGMHGILPRNGKIVRPLLCFTRKEIEDFVNGHAIPYREDSSNISDNYMRNRLRHQVIPVLKELNPSLENTFAAEAKHFEEAAQLLKEQVENNRHLLKQEGKAWLLSYKDIRQLSAPNSIAFELLKPFGFHTATVKNLLKAREAQPGKQFFSPSHMAIKDRDQLIIVPFEEESEPRFEELFEARITGAEDMVPDPSFAFLDYDKLHFPLQVRYWQEGDRFHPLGMEGSKKLSDFFVDQKVPLHLKHRVPLLISGNEIAWVAGYRIADPFKVGPATEKVYEVRLRDAGS